jgi:hypothetical protein
VWKRQHAVYASPQVFARVIARLEKGDRLEVLERGAVWSRVRLPREKGEGWSILDAAPQRAGQRFASLGGAASLTSVALAVKGFDEMARQVAALRPDAEAAFETVRDAALEVDEVEAFARAGGLRSEPGRGVR